MNIGATVSIQLSFDWSGRRNVYQNIWSETLMSDMKMEAGIDNVRRIIRNKIYDKLLQDDALYQELFENHYQVVVNTGFHVDGYRHGFLNVDSGVIRIEQMRDLFCEAIQYSNNHCSHPSPSPT